MDPKTRAVTSIEQARKELDRALTELEQMPVLDPSGIGFVAHALTNYLAVMSATTELLLRALHNHPDPDVTRWLEGMNHAADLMQHTIGRLFHASAPADFPLKHDAVNVPVLIDRACQYYRRVASPKNIAILSNTIGDVPTAWADRVGVAVVVDSLLLQAVNSSNSGETIRVDVSSEKRQVVCRIRFGLTGGSPAGQERELRLGSAGSPAPGSDPTEAGDIRLSVAWEFADLMGGSLWSVRGSNGQTGLVFRLPSGP
jgi:signal transduction histidine kinase